jgi:hypothetical protein
VKALKFIDFKHHHTLKTNLFIDYEDPHFFSIFPIDLPFMNLIQQGYSLHSKFHDRIVDWLEEYYLKRFPKNGKAIVSLIVSGIKVVSMMHCFLSVISTHLFLVID